MDGPRHTVLVVEDDERLANLVASYLRDEGFTACIETRGDRVAAELAATHYDAVLLDIALPGKSGFDVCKEIRRSFAGAIVMLTAKSEEIDEVLGLELGADDYVMKPVRPRALLVRLQRLLRSNRVSSALKPLRVGPIVISPARREVAIAGTRVELGTLDFDLLAILANHLGTVVPRERLYAELRGIEWDGIDRWVDLAISRLRKKLGLPDLIKTIRNTGYMLVAATGAPRP